MPEFLKPELPKKVAKAAHNRQRPVSEKKTHSRGPERFVIRTKMPNTLAYWSDLMLGNAAFKSYNDNFRLTCLSAMQQRAKNDVPRQPKKVHWDYLLDEAGWLRRDFREERMWRMDEAKKMAGECLKAWMLREEERGPLVEDEDLTGSALAYRQKGARGRNFGWEGDFAVRTRVFGKDSSVGVLGKRKWDAASESGNDVRAPLKRPRPLRRFSCHVDDSI